jgi:predicted DNA-binding ribbon-helix-helix protein
MAAAAQILNHVLGAMTTSEGEMLYDGAIETAPETSAVSEPGPRWEQRILQYDGRRYSLRLEHEFWSALERIGERRKLRLNRLVADIARQCAEDDNLSSAVRVFCMTENQQSALARSAGADRTSLLALAETAPSPCFVLDADQIILGISDGFLRWSGVPRDSLLRQKVTTHFRFQGAAGFDAIAARAACGFAQPETLRIISVVPGRVLAAEARFVPMTSARGRPLYLVWVLS